MCPIQSTSGAQGSGPARYTQRFGNPGDTEPPPSYEESEFTARFPSNSRQPSRSPARPRSPDPNNVDDVWELLNDILRTRMPTSGRPMEERLARPPVHSNAEFFAHPRPSDTRQDQAGPQNIPQPTHLHANNRTDRDSGYFSDATTLQGSTPPKANNVSANPPQYNDLRPPSITRQRSYVRARPPQEARPQEAPPPPRPSRIRCHGQLRYRDNWTQDFHCSDCSMSHHTKKTFKLSHPSSRQTLHLDQRKIRAYHVPVSRSTRGNFMEANKSNLLCKICYKLQLPVSETFSGKELAEHLKTHDIEDLDEWLF